MYDPALINGLPLLHDNKIDGGYEASESRHVGSSGVPDPERGRWIQQAKTTSDYEKIYYLVNDFQLKVIMIEYLTTGVQKMVDMLRLDGICVNTSMSAV